MKRILLSVLTVVLLAAGAFARPGEKRFMISAGGGVAWPLSPSAFKDAWKLASLGVGGGVGYSITPYFAVTASLDYNKFAFDEDGLLKAAGVDELISLARSAGIAISIDVEGADVSILAVSANGKASIKSTSVSPYFLAGVGYFNISVSDVKVTVSAPSLGLSESATAGFSSESAFFLTGGLGLDIHAGESVDVFLQGTVGLGLTEGDAALYLPARAGVSVKL
jgi:opacity protein-like surface antigen